jgi:hypothetical protein
VTTIVYKDKTLASDTRLSSDENPYHYADCQKIKRVKGWLIGASGGWGSTEYYMRKFSPDYITGAMAGIPKDEDFTALAISPEGKIYYVEDDGVFGVLDAEYTAIGSGEKVAMVAMDMGATAKQAIKIAMKYDNHTGGKIQTLRLK